MSMTDADIRHMPLSGRDLKRRIKVLCFCETLGTPDDKYEAEAEATFDVTWDDEVLVDATLKINGVEVNDDIPGAYMDRLERKARKEFEEGD